MKSSFQLLEYLSINAIVINAINANELMLGEMYKLKRLLPVSARLQVFQSLEIWSNSSKTREQKIQENDFVFCMKKNLFGIRIFGIKADLRISNKKVNKILCTFRTMVRTHNSKTFRCLYGFFK